MHRVLVATGLTNVPGIHHSPATSALTSPQNTLALIDDSLLQPSVRHDQAGSAPNSVPTYKVEAMSSWSHTPRFRRPLSMSQKNQDHVLQRQST